MVISLNYSLQLLLDWCHWVSSMDSLWNTLNSSPVSGGGEWTNRTSILFIHLRWEYVSRVSKGSGNLLTVSCGWTSANLLELQKPNTVFPSGPLSLEEATKVISMTFIGGIIGNLVFPRLVRKIDCKRLMLAAAMGLRNTIFRIFFLPGTKEIMQILDR